MRNNTSDATEIRWDVVKSMLDDFPQLWDRTEQYLMGKKSPTPIAAAEHANPDTKELVQKALSEYRRQRSRK